MIHEHDIVIRSAVKEDMIPVSDLLRDLGLSLPPANNPVKIQAHWDRLWNFNPYYLDFNEDVFYGWVMLHRNEVVGFFGTIPRVYFLNGVKIPVAIASNWGVKKEYRKFTNLLCEAFFNSDQGKLKLVTTAIKPTGKIFERFNGKRMPDKQLCEVYMIPFRMEKLAKIKFSKTPLLYAIMKPFLLFFNYFMPWAIKNKFAGRNNNLSEIDINQLPDDFEIFWNEYLAKTKGFIASRSVSIMKWVYSDVKNDSQKKIFLYRSAFDQRIIGYASLIEEPVHNIRDIKRYKIVDLLVLSERNKKEILKELVYYTYRIKADILEVHLPGMIHRKEIPGLNFLRKVPSFPVYFHSTDVQIFHVLDHIENWNISLYDGDTSLG